MTKSNDPRVGGTASWPLLLTLLIALALGAGVMVGAYLLIGQIAPLDAGGITPAQRFTAAFATATAAGALVLLVVNVRKQDLAEQAARRDLTAAFTERFAAAASQLGSAAPAERLAGVYAMSVLADEYPTRQQQCVDVLCGYLRLPFDPETDGLVAHGTDTTRTEANQVTVTERSTVAARPFDRQVRETIVRVIVQHLQSDAVTSWSRLTYDFTGAHLTNAAFEEVTFSGERTSFARATFSGKVSLFDRATFSGEVSLFDRATFSGKWTSFSGVSFASKWTSFELASFSGEETSFSGVSFSGERTSFDGVSFASKWTSFELASFSGERTSFDGVSFASKRTSFELAPSSDGQKSVLSGVPSAAVTSFEEARFSRVRVTFNRATRNGRSFLDGLVVPNLTHGATVTADGEPFRGWPQEAPPLPDSGEEEAPAS
ncbi:MAG: hypothetical protein J0H73_06485 [Salana multivorans]|nr:hypothetical protein [Salana multivorans]